MAIDCELLLYRESSESNSALKWVEPEDTNKKKLPWVDSPGDATREELKTPLILPKPSNIQVIYELAPDGKGYYVREVVGDKDVRPPSYITREEFFQLQDKKLRDAYFLKKVRESTGTASKGSLLNPQINVNSKLFETIFGSSKFDIKPNASILLDLSIRNNVQKNPQLTQRQQSNTSFNFRQQIQLNVIGSIGEKLKLRVNYDTEATFAFDNQFKINYDGHEDAIIKKVEAGNVSLPINGSLISGGQNLFGVKLATQFGPVTLTTVASQQRGQTNEITVKQGAQQQPFELLASRYDQRRHYFLAHFFRENYETWLESRPNVLSPVQIQNIEVWVTNTNGRCLSNTRTAIGFVDLGESQKVFNPNYQREVSLPPANNVNALYAQISDTANRPLVRFGRTEFLANAPMQLQDGNDFHLENNLCLLTEGRDYIVNRSLGFISLNQEVPESDVLFVAYQYTLVGENAPRKVGELAIDQPADSSNSKVLFLKMLKRKDASPGIGPNTPGGRPYPAWDLMMKNVYRMGTGGMIRQDGFDIQIYYASTDGSGDINFFPAGSLKGRPMLQVFALDARTNNNEVGQDNRFDFMPGITVVPERGFIIFPVLEPFGDYLSRQLNNRDDSARFAFPQLYRFTQVDAEQYYPNLNRYKFKGKTAGASSSEIMLNTINVSEGSVKVTAGGTQLQEGTDFTVDYTVGKVTIINPGILSSGQDIRVTFETTTLFGIDQKTMVGVRADLNVHKDFQLGATLLNLNERTITPKLTIGNEPVNNLIWGIDGGFRKQSRFITNLLDKLPFYNTKTLSEVTFNGEFAQLLPLRPNLVGVANQSETGVAYIDDFEGTRQVIDLMNSSQWRLASLPRESPVFLEPGRRPSTDTLGAGYNRAKLAWYQIDPQFYNQSSLFDLDPKESVALNWPYSRRVDRLEVFPNPTNPIALPLFTFDLHFQPQQRGPYNYETSPARLNPDGTFRNPRLNWAGIMRRTATNIDFEAANFTFIEFWLMDPFLMDTLQQHKGGEMYINLGRISEDVLPDGQRSYENGLPTNAADNESNKNLTLTPWARIPSPFNPTIAFDNNPDARQFQDVGLDGLRDEDERKFFSAYIEKLRAAGLNEQALQRCINDPSSDNYRFFRDPININRTDPYAIIRRYSDYNGTEGNSPLNTPGEQFNRSATPNPDNEDINGDGTLNFRDREQYFEWKIEIRRERLRVGDNFIVDKRDTETKLPNGEQGKATWYLFRVPIRKEAAKAINNIDDFKAMYFTRLYLTNFEQEIIMRFAKFELVATQWRVFQDSLGLKGEGVSSAEDNSIFELGTLNKWENSSRLPFNYNYPPGIEPPKNFANPVGPPPQMNEQTMVMKVCRLSDGDDKGAFRAINYDLRNYKNLKLWVHAEQPEFYPANTRLLDDCQPANPDATIFIRIGSDVTENYYEYEVPLCPSVPGNQERSNIWRNNIEIELEKLNEAKYQRNLRLPAGPGRGAAYQNRFAYVLNPERREIVYVRGNPMLSQIRNIVVGIRNPKDDGRDICVEMWVNEIRATDYIANPGYAANARLNVKLADLGNVSLAAQYGTPYFGSIEKRINERSLEYIWRYDIAATMQLGLLFPKAFGLEIPFYCNYGERTITPLYDPLDADVKLQTTAVIAETGKDPRFRTRDDKLRQSVDYQRNYSYSFTNVRKLYVDQKASKDFWDIENFAFTYAYSDRYARNAQLEFRHNQEWRGAIGYNYNINPKPLKPFGSLKGPRLISDINFMYLPRTVALRLEGVRVYEAQRLRAISSDPSVVPPITYIQDFTIARTYNIRWDLTQSINLTYTARNLSRIDEPRGGPGISQEHRKLFWRSFFWVRQNPDGDLWEDPTYAEGIDSLKLVRRYRRNSFVSMGRNTTFEQGLTANYRLPFDKIKPIDWINASVNYTANFNWQAAALQNQSLGNNINNTRMIAPNVQLGLARLYKKFPAIEKKLLKPIPKKNLVSLSDSTRKEGDDLIVALKRAGKLLASWMLSIQSIDLTYNINQGTNLPGYMPETDNFGLDFGYALRNEQGRVISRSMAPGVGFALLGGQPTLVTRNREGRMIPGGGPWFASALNNGWFSTDSTMRTAFRQTNSSNFNMRTSVALFKGFRVDLTFESQVSESQSAALNFTGGTPGIFNRTVNGSFNMSFFSLGTAFSSPDDVFEKFSRNRQVISNRLRNQNAALWEKVIGDSIKYAGSPGSGNFGQVRPTRGSPQYWNGYTGTSTDVLAPAFLAAYGPYNVENIDLTLFHKRPFVFPFPNWNVNYNGLTEYEPFKQLFKSITIRHSYRSNYSYTYNLNVEALADADERFGTNLVLDGIGVQQRDSAGVLVFTPISVVNFQPVYYITSITINETFAPVLGVNLSWKNGLTTGIDFKRTRNVIFNIGSRQVTESSNTEFAINVAWRKDKFLKPLILFGKAIDLRNSMTFRFDFSIRDNVTINRTLDNPQTVPTQGTYYMVIKPSFDYQLSAQLTMRGYVEYNLTRPKISTSFPTSFTAVGVQMMFTLTN
jgi:cell surface protein SprA